MKIVVLGGTGGTGRQIVAQALDAGHDVTVYLRDPARAPAQQERLRSIHGSLQNEAALTEAVRGHDAVISALGRGLSFKSEHFIAQTVPHLIAAMTHSGVRRLIFMSAIGVGDTYWDAPVVARLFFSTLLRGIYADKAIGDRLIRGSELDWTLVQPAQLNDGALTGTYRVGEHLTFATGMPQVSRADTAHFIVRCLEDASTTRKTLVVSY